MPRAHLHKIQITHKWKRHCKIRCLTSFQFAQVKKISSHLNQQPGTWVGGITSKTETKSTYAELPNPLRKGQKRWVTPADLQALKCSEAGFEIRDIIK